jgi:hypothetical protein
MGRVTVENAYEPKPVPAMTGWKTKVGTITLIAGTALMGAADVAPSMAVADWMTFVGKILTGVGGGLTAFGLGHKLEKNKPIVKIETTAKKPPNAPNGNAGVIK